MARDEHYNIALSVFKKNFMSYLEMRWEQCSCLRMMFWILICSVRHHHVHLTDTLNNVLIAICHVPPP